MVSCRAAPDKPGRADCPDVKELSRYREMEKMDQVLLRFEADYDVVLECIQEVYGLEGEHLRLEGEHLRLGKDFLKKAEIILKPYYRKMQTLEQKV